MKGVFPVLLTMLLIVGCGEETPVSTAPLGLKVSIDDQNTVYCKGDGITETDARSLGAYLFQMGYFTSMRPHAVQLEKEKDMYLVRLDFHDKRAYDALINARANSGLMDDIYSAMRIMQALISKKVFAGAKTRVILATDTFYEFAFAGDELTPEEEEMVAAFSVDDPATHLQLILL